MGHIKPYHIMLVSLLSMQFVASDGSLQCLISKTPMCLSTFMELSAKQICGVDKGIQCLKTATEDCDINNSTAASAMEQVRKIEALFTDICQQGSEMNLAFEKHKDCFIGEKLLVKTKECAEIIIKAISEYKMTGNTEKDQKEIMKIACKHRDEVRKCTSTSTKEICGDDAESFQRKMADPFNNLDDIMCNNTSAIFMHFWTLLLQATAILMSLQYFRLTK